MLKCCAIDPVQFFFAASIIGTLFLLPVLTFREGGGGGGGYYIWVFTVKIKNKNNNN